MTPRTLGIDYGSKRIGLSLTNETGDFALPFSVVPTGGRVGDSQSMNAVEEIARVCAEYSVGKIVIGDSKDFSGSDNTVMKDIRLFANVLAQKTGLPVIFHPEFLTSMQAERLQGKNDMLDASAATIMLQSYLDTIKNQQLDQS